MIPDELPSDRVLITLALLIAFDLIVGRRFKVRSTVITLFILACFFILTILIMIGPKIKEKVWKKS